MPASLLCENCTFVIGPKPLSIKIPVKGKIFRRNKDFCSLKCMEDWIHKMMIIDPDR